MTATRSTGMLEGGLWFHSGNKHEICGENEPQFSCKVMTKFWIEQKLSDSNFFLST